MSRAEGQAGMQHVDQGVALVQTRDALLVVLSIALGVTLLEYATAPVIAVAVWWNANTIAHNFIHRPFFRAAWGNRVYSAYLSLLLGFPQSWWRERHLAHHAGRPARVRFHGQLAVEVFLVGGFWSVLIAYTGAFFWTDYLPGLAAGLGLCWVHGYYEHARGTVSHYGAVYNALFLNDGYHVEHHRDPKAHWMDLAERQAPDARSSRWPAILRWLEMADRNALDALERIALASRALQSLLLRSHERALRRLLPGVAGARTIRIVGGGMFPRTAILLGRLMPDAALTIVDSSAEHLAIARQFIGGAVRFDHREFDGTLEDTADLVVIPLSFRGNRQTLYLAPPATRALIHDWIWRPRGESVIVSWLLLKRLNLIRREPG
jgi:hypothetical protein